MKRLAEEYIDENKNLRNILLATIFALSTGTAGSALVSLLDDKLWTQSAILKVFLVVFGLTLIMLLLWKYLQSEAKMDGWYNALAIEDVDGFPDIYPLIIHNYEQGKKKRNVQWINRKTGEKIGNQTPL